MDDKLRKEVLSLLEQAEATNAPAPVEQPAEDTVDPSALIHSSTDRLPQRPFEVTLENGTVITHN